MAERAAIFAAPKVGFGLRAVVPPAVVLVGAAALVEVALRAGLVSPYVLARPTAVAFTLRTDAGLLLASLWGSAQAALLGFAASAVLGVSAAVVLSSSGLARRAFYPYAVFFQTVPIIAVAPLLINWLDPGLPAVATCAFIVSVFPVIANTLTGLTSTDPHLLDLFRLYGARRPATLLKLRLPSALPSLFGGLRVAAGLAVIGTVVAEFLVGRIEEGAGLGVTINSAIRAAKTDRVFAGVLLTSLLGLALFGAVNLASHLALRRWHASERE